MVNSSHRFIFFRSNPTNPQKHISVAEKNRRRKIEKEVMLLGSTMSVLLRSYISSIGSLDQTESENLKGSKFFLTIPTKPHGGVYPTTNVCHYQLRFFQWILVRLWVPPPTLASSACRSVSCTASKQWPAQDDCQRYALDLGPCNMAKGE